MCPEEFCWMLRDYRSARALRTLDTRYGGVRPRPPTLPTLPSKLRTDDFALQQRCCPRALCFSGQHVLEHPLCHAGRRWLSIAGLQLVKASSTQEGRSRHDWLSMQHIPCGCSPSKSLFCTTPARNYGPSRVLSTYPTFEEGHKALFITLHLRYSNSSSVQPFRSPTLDATERMTSDDTED
ncbi:hypothetical protein N431DRAFT_132425 [Stipitochalara longipes BDJ]|nr:hypothetical protein N431DRAFT_132425 [Stipitochalara longipes BDJ]